MSARAGVTNVEAQSTILYECSRSRARGVGSKVATTSTAKKTKLDTTSTADSENVAISGNAAAAVSPEIAISRRTATDEERSDIEKTVNLLIGEGTTSVSSLQTPTRPRPAITEASPHKTSLKLRVRGGGKMKPPTSTSHLAKKVADSPQAKCQKGKQSGETSTAKKTKLDTTSTADSENVTISGNAAAAVSPKIAISRRTATDEERADIEKTVNLLIGEGTTSVSSVQTPTRPRPAITEASPHKTSLKLRVRGGGKMKPPTSTSHLAKKVADSPQAKCQKGKQSGETSTAKKTKLDTTSTADSENVAISGNAAAAVSPEIAISRRTATDEERADIEKTVNLLIGEGPVQVPAEGTPVDRPPLELGVVPDEFSATWKADQDQLSTKEEEERAERRKS